MAHKINITDKGAAFASAKERAWHGLGQVVEGAMSSEEAIKLALLDYKVEKMPTFYEFNKKKHQDPNRFATVRMDSGVQLGNVGKGYEVIQNSEAFKFFDSILDSKLEPIFETAGALGDGEKIFITAKLPKRFKLKKAGEKGTLDEIENYLMLTNSHDGNSAIICGLTPIRIVCNNTLNMALGKLNHRYTIKHHKNAGAKLEEAAKIIGIVDASTAVLEQVFNKMVDVSITDGKLKEYIAMVLSNSDKMISAKQFETEYSQRLVNVTNEIYEYALGNETQKLATTKGTIFGAYNAITGYYQNIKEYKNESEKMDSLILNEKGQPYLKTAKAFRMAAELAGIDVAKLS